MWSKIGCWFSTPHCHTATLQQGRFPKNIWVLRGIALFGQLQTCWVCQSFVACVALSCVMDSLSPGLHILENTKRRAKIPSTEILRAVLDSSLSWIPSPVNHWNIVFTAFNGPRLLLSQRVSLFPPPAFAQYLKDSSHTWKTLTFICC